MGILKRLASSRGEKKQDSNAAVAMACLADPSLLAEIVEGLGSKDARLVLPVHARPAERCHRTRLGRATG